MREHDDVNIAGENTDAMLDASKECGLDVNLEKIKYMLTSCYKEAGQKYSIRIESSFFEGAAKLKYLGTITTDQTAYTERLIALSDLGENPVLCCERPETNRLSHGTAYPRICTTNKQQRYKF